MNEQEIIFDEVNIDWWEQNVMLSRLGIDPSRIGSTPYNPEMVHLFGALMQPAGSREVRPGVWEHTFGSCDESSAVKQVVRVDEPGKEPQWNLSYQGHIPVDIYRDNFRPIYGILFPQSTDKPSYRFRRITKEGQRQKRLRKIKRRTMLAAYRRKKRGLA
jgi:hypothetical protein